MRMATWRRRAGGRAAFISSANSVEHIRAALVRVEPEYSEGVSKGERLPGRLRLHHSQVNDLLVFPSNGSTFEAEVPFGYRSALVFLQRCDSAERCKFFKVNQEYTVVFS
jgi:hypothetical protein